MSDPLKNLVFILVALALTGCDKLTGAADQKIADAEAIGFACRVSAKTPEACMKENEAQSPSSMLDGWKSADEDIKAGKLDPNMSNVAAPKKEGDETKPVEGEKPAEGDKPAEGATEKDVKTTGKPVEGEKDNKATKPDAPKEEKPAESKAKH
jgi:hypothetical protein